MSQVYEPIDRFSPERAEVLAKLIEGLPKSKYRCSEEGFSMERFAHLCGTPSCIAGWAASLLGRSLQDASSVDLQLFLGCTFEQAKWLAYGHFRPGGFIAEIELFEITPAEAAAAIRQLAERLSRN